MTARLGAPIVGIGLALAAAMLWGSTGTIQALLPEDREPFVVAALRLAFGAAFLLALASATRAGRRGLLAAPALGVIGAGVSIAAYNLLFFNAVVGAGVGLGTALAIGSAPIWATAFETAAGRPPTGARLLGQGACIAGAAILVVAGRDADATLAGVFLALAAGAAYVSYSLITSSIGRSAPSASIAAATFAVAAIVSAPALWLYPTDWVADDGALAQLAFLGIAATGVAYALYTASLRLLAPSAAVTLALAEPLTAWLLATFLLGEANTPSKIAGALLLFMGLAIVGRTAGAGASARD